MVLISTYRAKKTTFAQSQPTNVEGGTSTSSVKPKDGTISTSIRRLYCELSSIGSNLGPTNLYRYIETLRSGVCRIDLERPKIVPNRPTSAS